MVYDVICGGGVSGGRVRPVDRATNVLDRLTSLVPGTLKQSDLIKGLGSLW